MPTCPTFHVTSYVLAFAAMAAAAEPASALDAALAKRCRDMAITAFPTKPAGSASGHAKDQRNFYNDCIAKEGNIDPPPPANDAVPAGANKDAAAPPSGTPK